MKPKDSRYKSASSMRQSVLLTKPATKSLLLNLEDFAEPLVSVPPDGGWGWVIVAASFLVMFCLDGIGYCFAIFFQDISKDLNCEITEVALSSSMLGGFYFLSGPLTCSAINRYGFQKIAVAGGALAIFAFTAASYVKNVLAFTVLVGFFGGSAFNLIYTPSVIAIGFYFEKWRALAMAITCCGSSIGVMCVPVIMTKLLDKLTWRTKFRILAGVFGICGVLGLTYRPIPTTKVERTVQFGDVATAPSAWSIEEDESELNMTGGGLLSIFQRFKNVLFPTISEVSVYSSRRGSREPSRFSSRNSGLGSILNRRDTDAQSYYLNVDADNKSVLHPVMEEDIDEEGTHRRCQKCRDCCSWCCRPLQWSGCCKNVNSDDSSPNISRPMYRDDIFYTGSVNLLAQSSRISRAGGSQSTRQLQKGVPSLYTLSVTRAPTQKDIEEHGQCKCCPEAFKRVLATMLDFGMLSSPTFILLLISGYLSLMGTYIVYTYIVERALEMGVDEEHATLLLSILGIANSFGRATCGVVSCLQTDINVISWITIGICGGSTIASVYLTTALGQIIFCCIFGFTIATFAVLRAIMFVELFGIENLTNCFGLNMIFQSAAAFSGVPIANYLFKMSKAFEVPFLFTGAAITVSAVLLIPIRCILRREQKKTRRQV